MTSEEYARQAGERMRNDGSAVSTVSLAGGPAVVGYQSSFKLKWMATKLHLFVVLVEVPQATTEILTLVTTQAVDYAKQTKGKLRGLQTGVAIIPALIAGEVLPEARAAVETRPAKAFAAMTLPAIVDLANGQTYSYSGRLLWGGIYASWLRKRLGNALPPPAPASG